MKKVIIVGATSGIGRELARLYAGAGNLVGVTGRRQDLLYSLQLEFPNHIVTECYDVTGTGNQAHLGSLIGRMGGMDLLLYNSGYGETSEQLDWAIEQETVAINVNAFLEVVNFGWTYFVQQGHGHLATTSSIASRRGNSRAPAYSASKAFQSVYFEGLHIKAKKLAKPIYVTDIQPGFVDTKLAKGEGLFWVAPVDKAARQIYQALEKKKWRVFITRRWGLIAWLIKWIPDGIFHRIG